MAEDISRFEDEVIPTSDASWRHCIEVKCGIVLTAGYVEERIRVLADPAQEETQRFARTYGPEHLKQVIGWFRLARAKRHDSDAAAAGGPDTWSGPGRNPDGR
jgi:hypothetical protein